MEENSSNEYRQIRIDKIKKLKEMGINPFAEKFERTHLLSEAKELPEDTENVSLAGRIMLIRMMGKLSFAHIQDQTGKMQIAIEKKTIGEEIFNELYKKLIDIGDFIGVKGKIFKTRTGEVTLLVNELTFLSKTLRPLPEKWHGITDKELNYRQRYLDLVMNEETKKRFEFRTKVVTTIRNFLDDNKFMEVETPVLQTKPSGALATPFKTHHNALDIDCYLRIAPETYLKRLIVSGFDKVYEFARCFRNEGMDPSHLQDFTMLEYYCAYWNYEDNMRFTEKIIQNLLENTIKTMIINVDDNEIDLTPPYPIKSLGDVIKEHADIDINTIETEELRKFLKERNIAPKDMDKLGRGSLIDQVFKKVCRAKLIKPHFIIHHPIDISPLARKNDENPQITDRFQLLINGWEVVNAYSELIDPIDQRQRMEEQASLKEKGDEEAHPMDEDYLLAMEYGMPPVSGWGMGIDRIVTLLTNQENLRDVVFFPLMKPQE